MTELSSQQSLPQKVILVHDLNNHINKRIRRRHASYLWLPHAPAIKRARACERAVSAASGVSLAPPHDLHDLAPVCGSKVNDEQI